MTLKKEKTCFVEQDLPAGQEPQVNVPGRFIHVTGGSTEHTGLPAIVHSLTSTVQAGSDPLADVHPSSHIHVYFA